MNYELWLTNDRGGRIDLLDEAESFSWNKVINDIGHCQVRLHGTYDLTQLQRDYRIEIWRSPSDTAKLKLENIFFIRRINPETTADGLDRITVFGVDPTELLKRRIVAYAAGSAQANKTDFIDDMMKDIVRENLGATAAAARDYTANGFTVQPDAGLGPNITKAFSRRNVLTILQDLSDAARVAGNEVYFMVVATSVTTFEFRTFINQPGQDRRHGTSVTPMLFGLDYGNLENPSLDEDYEEEVNFVYGGGQGEAAGRNIQTAQDNVRINQSTWNRREAFRDSRHEATNAGVLSEAQARLNEGRPRRKFQANLLSVENYRYGLDWNFGDRITTEYFKRQYDSLIRAVEISVDQDRKEIVRGRVEVEDVA